jgi:hypothetical protein
MDLERNDTNIGDYWHWAWRERSFGLDFWDGWIGSLIFDLVFLLGGWGG